MYRYSLHHQKGTIQVVQMESEAHRTKELQQELARLERVIGQKQVQLEYLERLIAIAGEALQIDLFALYFCRRTRFRTKSGRSSAED